MERGCILPFREHALHRDPAPIRRELQQDPSALPRIHFFNSGMAWTTAYSNLGRSLSTSRSTMDLGSLTNVQGFHSTDMRLRYDTCQCAKRPTRVWHHRSCFQTSLCENCAGGAFCSLPCVSCCLPRVTAPPTPSCSGCQ